ncbi:hypothetical protein GDO86_012462 [Hymenochirus boettgeri]|uniref:CWH43-like N-terminal domain-containing protein n=1 Tax=Hymenochirus boettgeri TaxID=247094 RepID=A0A8T2IV99_9PIPI|nr:hypothetical protein GDO86_012462 [Hymenochirus boettgeri]
MSTWAILPIFLSIWACSGIWIVYAMAVSNGSVNVTSDFPFISTCGTYPPQSCIFGQVLNIGALLAVWISAIRFQQIRDYGYHSTLNTVSLVMGLICALGTSLVGNFQQSNQLDTHLAGAFLAFFVGNIYFWTQSALTYMVKPSHGACFVGPLRFCLSLACTALVIMMAVFFSRDMKSIAAICEWIVAMVLFLLYGLFAVEFWHLDGHFFHVKKKTVIPNEMVASNVMLNMYQ